MSRSSRSVKAALTRDYKPSDLMEMPQTAFLLLEEIRAHFQNQVLDGGKLSAPTTPSAQLTGTGNTTFRVKVAAALGAVAGVMGEKAEADDTAIHGGSYLTGFAVGQACRAAVVLAYKASAGTFHFVTVKGTVALLAAALGPDDAQIDAAVDAALSTVGDAWIVLGETMLSRTADTVVAQTYYHVRRPVLGVTAGYQIDL